jgi:hypothetical protein
MNLQPITLTALAPSHTARTLDEKIVAALEASLAEIGLLQPIVAREETRMMGGIPTSGFRIVAGHHRAEAARRLGWETITANLLDESAGSLNAELVEIDENLCRSELSPAQRAIAIKRRKQIWEALHPTDQVEQIVPPEIGYKKPPPQSQAFAAETAAISGQSKQDINRHLSRAEALGDDLAAVAGTSLDKGVELDALKTLHETERKRLIALAKSGELVSARAPASRIHLLIEYFDVQDGACSLALSIIRRDKSLAYALLTELQSQLGKE